jgi:hypothetical protein
MLVPPVNQRNYKLKFADDADVIFTCYFTSKENPQRNPLGHVINIPKNSLSYIFPWYASVTYHKLNAVIIHDGLDEEFIQQHQRHHIEFIYHDPKSFSLNDERFCALALILEANKLGKVLFTDVCDLIIKKNPFEFMTNLSQLYFGSDLSNYPRIRDNPWCVNKTFELLGKPGFEINQSFLDFEYINAGAYGGHYENIKQFTQALVLLFQTLASDANNNMMAINYLLWKYKIPHFKGQPFTSPFKQYDLAGDYYLVHK